MEPQGASDIDGLSREAECAGANESKLSVAELFLENVREMEE